MGWIRVDSEDASVELLEGRGRPLSWPSCPILATSILGLLPSSSAKASMASVTALISLVSPYSALYAPDTILSLATCLPYTASMARVISPTEQRALAADMANSKRFPSPDFADSWIAAREASAQWAK